MMVRFQHPALPSFFTLAFATTLSACADEMDPNRESAEVASESAALSQAPKVVWSDANTVNVTTLVASPL